MEELRWTQAEKKIARKAFEAALERECRAIRARVVRMLEKQDDPRQIWRVHNYLSEERRDFDRKYDYRYSRLVSVFGVLLREGWLTEPDLTGLAQEKAERIKTIARLGY
jgi:Photoprotection regulator fluorescence recovery protein